MGEMYRAFGPPGTGKTTWMARQLKHAAERYDPESIYACSFTAAAARELAGRDTGIPRQNIGTIHSLCYHELGRPSIIEGDKEKLELWNKTYGRWWPVKGVVRFDDPVASDCDALLIYNRERSMLTARRAQPRFVEAWERFKSEHYIMDFTDLLTNAPDRLGARVLMVDEGQDLTPLQFRIIQQWGSHTDVFIVSLDDDQCIYEFLGANPSYMLDGISESNTRVLSQSYRLASAIHEYSQGWVSRLGSRRYAKEFKGRDDPGAVERDSRLKFAQPEALVDRVEQAAEEGTCAILTTCGYMLHPILDELKKRGLTFGNPYCGRGDWNPLGSGKRAGRLISFRECHVAFVNGDANTLSDPRVWEWVGDIRTAGNLQKGAKKAMSERAVNMGFISEYGTPALVEATHRGDPGWLIDNTIKSASYEYPVAVYRRHGIDALVERPKIIVGTIHSIKGGEADSVVILPDLPYAAIKELSINRVRAKDALIRQFYVGFTRARNRLILAGQSGKHAVRWMGGI